MKARARLDLATMRDIAKRSGCRIVLVRSWNTATPGHPGLVYDIDFPSHAHKVRLLDALAWHDAKRNPAVRELALGMARRAGSSDLARARYLQRALQSVAFVREPTELFQDPVWTLWNNAGDCDDHYRAAAALGRAMGLRVRPRTLMSRKRRGVPTHVAPQFGFPSKLPRRWVWAETTLRAKLGEHPRAAKRRLRARGRDDV